MWDTRKTGTILKPLSPADYFEISSALQSKLDIYRNLSGYWTLWSNRLLFGASHQEVQALENVAVYKRLRMYPVIFGATHCLVPVIIRKRSVAIELETKMFSTPE